MKQQVLIIHGGRTFSSYKNYITWIKKIPIELEKIKYRLDWKDSIASDLGDKYEVFAPRMPNNTNAKYKEWVIWFEHIIPLLRDGVILVGHSLGGIFLAKYLSEKVIPKKTKAVILVSAPYGELGSEELASFILSRPLKRFNEQIKKIILIQSEDDSVVPLDHVYEYHKDLPNSEVILFKDRGHFKQEHFPELVNLIKSLKN